MYTIKAFLIFGLILLVFATNATASPSIYWGARMDGDPYGLGSDDAPWGDTTWNTFETHADKKVSIVHWGSTYPETFSQNSLTQISKVRGKGAIPLISWSTSTIKLSDISAGNYDSFFQNWATAAASSRIPFFLRLDWEMNGNWFPWGTTSTNINTTADYVSMWRHVHDIFTTAGATNVTWVWCPNTVYPGSTPLGQIYPGDDYVDWVCFDGYNWGNFKGGWQTFTQVAGPTYAQLQSLAPTKPIMIAETASSETGAPGGTSKSFWITDVLITQLPTNFPKIKAFVWFNWNIFENGARLDWPIESSPQAQAAFASGISSPVYATNIFSNLHLSYPILPLMTSSSTSDLKSVLTYWNGIYSCNGFLCDFNFDGRINAIDANMVLKAI